MSNHYNKLFLDNKVISISEEETDNANLDDLYAAEKEVEASEKESSEKYNEEASKAADELIAVMDIADVAIFDNTVSESGEEQTEDVDINSDSDDEQGDSPELIFRDYYIASQEGLLRMAISTIIKVTALAIRGVVLSTKYLRKGIIFCRDRALNISNRNAIIAKMWELKLKDNLDKVDEERLAKYEISALPFDKWTSVARLSVDTFELVKKCEKSIFDASPEAMTPYLKKHYSNCKDLGIEFDIAKNKIKLDNLLDEIRHEGVLQLGYGRTQMPVMLRYFTDLGKAIPKGEKHSVLEPIMNETLKKISNTAAILKQEVDDGKVKDDSKEYKKRADAIITYTARYDYMLNCMKLSYYLFDLLGKQGQDVFRRYEESLALKALAD